jgi:hypothetical protein
MVAAIVSGVVFVVVRTALPHDHPPGSHEATHSNLLLASDALLALIAGWAALSLRRLVLVARGVEQDAASIAHRPGTFLGLFMIVWSVLLAWWAGEWPGHMRTDEAYLFDRVSSGASEPWLSTAYSVYVLSVMRVLRWFTAVSLVNTLLIAAAVADVLSLLLHAGAKRRWVVLIAALVVTSIPLGLTSICLSHDVLCVSLKALLFASLLRAIVRIRLSRGAAQAGLMVTPVLLALFAAMLRGENIVLPFVVPIALWLASAAGVGRALLAFAASAAFLLAWRGPLERSLIEPGYNPEWRSRYKLTLVINPLSYYLANQYWSPTPEQDREVLARVVDMNDMTRLHTPFDIDTYWTGASKGDVTNKEMREVQRLFRRATLDNPTLFLSSRVATVGGMLGFSPRANLWVYPRREQRPLEEYARGNPSMQRVFDAGMRWRERDLSPLSRLTHALRDWSLPRGFFSPGAWLWNAWPSLLVLVLALFTPRRAPAAALLAFVVLAPFALVALAGPASHFKYIFDVYLLGVLVLAVWLWDRAVASRRAERARVTARG